jgi:FkbM family methyltransferase
MSLLHALTEAARSLPPLVKAYRNVRDHLGERYPEFARAVWNLVDDARHPTTFQATPLGFAFAGNESMQAGAHEPDLTEHILGRLKACDAFIDVGANIGYYACIARKAGVHVVAVEPLQSNLAVLYRNLDRNGWEDVEIFPLGLGAAPGVLPLYGASTGASVIKGWSGSAASHKRLIPLSTLDIVLGDRFQGKRLVIKVDVEGGEHAMLLGAERTLARTPSPVWLLEVCLTQHHPGAWNPEFRAVFETFWSRGYRVRTIEHVPRAVSREDVDRWIERRHNDFEIYNFSFDRPE